MEKIKEVKNTKENNIISYEADAIQPGLTDKKTNENEICRISQEIGLSKNDIKNTLKKNRFIIAVFAVFVLSCLVTGNLYFIGNHYSTGSIADFQIFRWFL